jgi:hypothetical protein
MNLSLILFRLNYPHQTGEGNLKEVLQTHPNESTYAGRFAVLKSRDGALRTEQDFSQLCLTESFAGSVGAESCHFRVSIWSLNPGLVAITGGINYVDSISKTAFMQVNNGPYGHLSSARSSPAPSILARTSDMAAQRVGWSGKTFEQANGS